MFYQFGDFQPVCHPSSFVHPQATIIGNVIIGASCYIGPHAVLRGDWGPIVLEDGCNVQEGCCLHMFPGMPVLLRRDAHIGHGAVVHGAEIGENVLVGMNAVIMDEVRVGAGSIIGALSFVPARMEIPERSLVLGNPAKITRQVTDEQLAWKSEGTRLYQQLPAQWQAAGHLCEPLESVEPDRPQMPRGYAPRSKT
jgi:Carbonic anhydrases/acetyltransferases, isoleucine patch superfamily